MFFKSHQWYRWGFPGGSEVKVSACNAGDLGSIPGSGRFPWRRKWQPTPVFLPGESHGRRSLVGYIHGVAKSRTQLSNLALSIMGIYWDSCSHFLTKRVTGAIWVQPHGDSEMEDERLEGCHSLMSVFARGYCPRHRSANHAPQTNLSAWDGTLSGDLTKVCLPQWSSVNDQSIPVLLASRTFIWKQKKQAIL